MVIISAFVIVRKFVNENVSASTSRQSTEHNQQKFVRLRAT